MRFCSTKCSHQELLVNAHELGHESCRREGVDKLSMASCTNTDHAKMLIKGNKSNLKLRSYITKPMHNYKSMLSRGVGHSYYKSTLVM